ncbi:MAG: hypothetical protein EBZ36_03975, partial [Acidobacteria bacterium]|nr:hypothetical protein [Acidobacteriota bacterium]
RRQKRWPGKATQTSEPMENVPVARLLPIAKFTNRAEPCTLIQNYTTKPLTQEGRFRLWLFERHCAEANGLLNEGEPAELHQAAPEGPDDPPL